MSLIDQLKAKQGFTEAECSIASYVLHHAEDVPHMTVGELSESANVSKAAVIRLCKKLGLQGYRDLRVELASELEKRRSQLANIDANQPFSVLESNATMMRSVAQLQQEAIIGCYQSLSPARIDEVARGIYEARRVVIYSLGDSCIVSSLFGSKLAKVGIESTMAGLYGDLMAPTAMLGPQDYALIVTCWGTMLKGILRDTGIAAIAQQGCKVGVITGLAENDPLLAGADQVISFRMQESRRGAIGPFYSTTCLNYIFNCIYARVYAYDFVHHGENKDLVDALNMVGTEGVRR